METKSEPVQYREEHVTDLDIAFVGAPIYSLTLDPLDTIDYGDDDRIVVQIKTSTGEEVITYLRRSMLWYSLRPRIRRVAIPAPGKEAPLPAPAITDFTPYASPRR